MRRIISTLSEGCIPKNIRLKKGFCCQLCRFHDDQARWNRKFVFSILSDFTIQVFNHACSMIIFPKLACPYLDSIHIFIFFVIYLFQYFVKNYLNTAFELFLLQQYSNIFQCRFQYSIKNFIPSYLKLLHALFK